MVWKKDLKRNQTRPETFYNQKSPTIFWAPFYSNREDDTAIPRRQSGCNSPIATTDSDGDTPSIDTEASYRQPPALRVAREDQADACDEVIHCIRMHPRKKDPPNARQIPRRLQPNTTALVCEVVAYFMFEDDSLANKKSLVANKGSGLADLPKELGLLSPVHVAILSSEILDNIVRLPSAQKISLSSAVATDIRGNVAATTQDSFISKHDAAIQILRSNGVYPSGLDILQAEPQSKFNL
ncbi:hypothetical protein CC78DRAFT_542649 [Lojkania enalia]|uniref:Uncharacterized protein n=1 Tax=Lojkania enalia TaxID=147567 RepID=A0A9P4N8R3_9PLEO|nr:hypothetical protein CC78DRAFT_542649 [Didymosphaeria enalia]